MHDYLKECFTVKITLDCSVNNTLETKTTFDEFLKFLRQLKKRAFVTLGQYTINKMHIVSIETPLSGTATLFTNDFIHEQTKDVTHEGKFWCEAFDEWCEGLGD